ncbi:MAG TPA: HEPN domain-containing protein [Alphaproteobacteria bacterium]|nr:HEPN domain-containing protein [Alphaproteobacteria bacterium]
MNAPDKAQEALRWLRFAQEDLAEAERLLTLHGATPRHICWFAQQAAEKALKAALVLEDAEVPFWHNLNALRNLLPESWAVKSEYPDLAELTEWAVEARYPGEWPEATSDDARRAAVQARGVVDCIVRDFARRGVAVRPT